VSALLSLRSPRTTRVVVVTLLWITRTLASLLVACPLIFAITSSGLVSGPEHDTLLFQPGALGLLELVRAGAPLLVSGLKTSLLFGATCAVLGLLPLGAALELLGSQDTDGIGRGLARGFSIFPRFLALSAITLLAQAALLLATSLLATALSAGLHGRDERVQTLAPLLVFGVGLVYCAWLGAVQDVARSVVVRHNLRARPALFEALTILREQPWAVLLGSYPSAAGSAFAWLSAAWLVTKLDLSSPAKRGIVLAFVVHQVAILLSIALRVRWLGAALTLGARAPSARD
jgi:hypothetical protein